MPEKRGYLLITVADSYVPKQVAQKVIELDIGDKGYVVRADVVTNSPGLVAPTVAEKNYTLADIQEEIVNNIDGVEYIELWPVEHHVPKHDTGKKYAGDDPGTVGTNGWG